MMKHIAILLAVLFSLPAAYAAKPIKMIPQEVYEGDSANAILESGLLIAKCEPTDHYFYVRTGAKRKLESKISVKVFMPVYPSTQLAVAFITKDGSFIYEYELESMADMDSKGFATQDSIAYMGPEYVIENSFTNKTKALEFAIDYEGGSLRFNKCKVTIPKQPKK
ncbi:MAG: hypothetical protein IT289_01260 [Oligoflexia bacterium]|nr:hypothetical protein [Oligoflexia bacterium]